MVGTPIREFARVSIEAFARATSTVLMSRNALLQSLCVRLKRRIPGEWLHGSGDLEIRLSRRSEIQPRRDPVRQFRAPIEYKVRLMRRRASTEPNTPQLIRLRRQPATLDKVRFRRDPAAAKARPEPRERVGVAKAVRAALAVERKAFFPRPTDVHPPLVVRQPIDVEAFLAWRTGAGR